MPPDLAAELSQLEQVSQGAAVVQTQGLWELMSLGVLVPLIQEVPVALVWGYQIQTSQVAESQDTDSLISIAVQQGEVMVLQGYFLMRHPTPSLCQQGVLEEVLRGFLV